MFPNFNESTLPMLAEGILDTLYMTLASTLIAYIIGLPLGVFLAATGKGGVRPLPLLNKALGFIVNIVRSVPFLILIILLLPYTRLVAGTTIGPIGMIMPLSICAAPFVARLVEASLTEVDRGIVEAAWSMGSSPMKILLKVLLPESRTSLLLGATITVVTVLGYSAMAGILGGGGLGDIAIRFGYYRYQGDVMIVTVILLVIIVQA
ncbi:MAG: ABC transporter permease, partial [Clostridiales Family XIII bacterium]|nr:ABC transporter permease [Clostridiales Family XIII bacterium]